MSETRPTYVACASGHNVFTDCLVQRHGDLIRLIGHSQMDFTATDAKDLAYYILDLLDDPYQALRSRALAPAIAPASGGAADSGDPIVEETIALLRSRSKLGQEKYGATLMRDDLILLDWMRYAVEESLDRTLYMLRAIKDLEKLYDDGR